MSNEKYHYEPGAIHNDHHKEINIGSVTASSLKEFARNFLGDDVEEADCAFVNLRFFNGKSLTTAQSQENLRNAIQTMLPLIDKDAGRDWIALYIAYHYATGTLSLQKKFVDFFCDIETLCPNVLNKINVEQSGDKRYKSYTESLSSECDRWFIENGCLPPINEWTSPRYNYNVTEDRKNRFQKLAKEIIANLRK